MSNVYVTTKKLTFGRSISVKFNDLTRVREDLYSAAATTRDSAMRVGLKDAAEKAVRDAGDKIGDDVEKPIAEKIDAVKKAKDGEDADAIKSAIADLSAEIQKIGQAFYTKGNETGGTEPKTKPDAGNGPDPENSGTE